MGKENKVFCLVLVSFFLFSYVFGVQVNTSVATISDAILVEENYSTAQEATDAVRSMSIEADQTVASSFQGNLSGTIQGGHQMLQLSTVSNSSSFSRHIMCKNHSYVWDPKEMRMRINPVDPTTTFRPSDAVAEILTTVSVDESIEFKWYYRNDSDKTWVFAPIPLRDRAWNFSSPGTYDWVAWFNIAEYWPGSHYPRAYKVEVYLDDSPLPSFSEFFEVTNGGLNSPRMCEDVDGYGYPVNMKSQFTIDNDTEAHHYLRFDNIAYFNEELGYCHNFTTVWIQPNGSAYKTYSGNFSDYKDTNVTWNYWESGYTPSDYISINSSTPIGNWKVEVYIDSYFNNTWMRYGPIATTPFIVGSEPVADWTFMVYLDADNNLENASIDIFLNMSSVGSSSQVNIVAQMDRIPGQDARYNNWTDCKRFNITKGMTPTPGNATLDLGEVNMGHPDTLKDFINWTIYQYPANYYFLTLWDHGIGCMGLCFDMNIPESASDFLTLPELSQALSGLPAIMDVVLLDACSMSMTEVAYQIKDYANVLVGPEGLGYAPAPYDDYLSSLTNNPSMLPNAFAEEVVTDYIDWCKPIGNIQNATMAATDLTEIASLMAAIENFALKLKEKETSYNNLIDLARNLTAQYQGPYASQSGYYIDLYHFAQLTHQHILDEELQDTSDQVMTALSIGNAIIIKANKAHPNSHGLSIFFPNEEAKYDSFGSVYEETTFAEDMPWDEFVKYHLLHQQQCYITVDSAHGSPTSSQWVDKGYNLTVTVTSPTEIILNQTRWNCTGYKIDDGYLQDGTSYSFETIQVPHTIEFYWIQQFWLQVNTTESGSTVEGTGWHDIGASASISAATPYQLNSTHRFVFARWNSTGINEALITGPSSSLTTVTMNNYYTVQANWQEQYHLTINSAYGITAGQDWYDSDTQATFNVISPVDHGNGTRRIFIQWSGDSNATTTNATIIMNSPYTLTVYWKTQYYFTVAGNPYNVTTISGDGWYENGTVATTGTAELSIHGVGVRYVFLTWVVDGSNVSGNPVWVTADSPHTAIALYETIYSSSISLLSLSLDKIQKGETILVNGSITPAIEGATVTLTYRRPDGSLLNRTVISLSDGRFTDTYTPDVAGTWNLTASWSGDVDHDGAASSAVSFRVMTIGWWEPLLYPETLPVILGVVGIVFTGALVGTVWVRTRRRRAVTRVRCLFLRSLTKPIDQYSVLAVLVHGRIGAENIISDLMPSLEPRCTPIILLGPTAPTQLSLPEEAKIGWVTTVPGVSELKYPILSPEDPSMVNIFITKTLEALPEGMKPVILGDFLDNMIPHMDEKLFYKYYSDLASAARIQNYTVVFVVKTDIHREVDINVVKRFADVIIEYREREEKVRLVREVRVSNRVDNIHTNWEKY